MSAAHEEIARRVAARLAPAAGEKLPVYVERRIMLGEAADEGPPTKGLDAMQMIQLATFAVFIAKTAWDVVCKLEENRRRSALGDEEIALLREMMARAIREGAPAPAEVPGKLRIAAEEAAVDEAVAEARRTGARR